MIDLMHIGEKVVSVHAVFAHHAAHGGAITPVIVLLDPTGFLCGHPEEGADELANSRIDLMPKIDVMRIQRVVEVEHPCVDIGKEARGGFHCIHTCRHAREGGHPVRRGNRETPPQSRNTGSSAFADDDGTSLVGTSNTITASQTEPSYRHLTYRHWQSR